MIGGYFWKARAILQAIHRISIDDYFEKNGHCAFSLDDLSDFITAQRAGWRLPKPWSIKHICRLLVDGGWLRAVALTSDLYAPKTRFAAKLASRFQIALSIKRGSYLSHGTAASLHSLIEPDTGITTSIKNNLRRTHPVICRRTPSTGRSSDHQENRTTASGRSINQIPYST
jgi:hypothetical protein